VSEAGEMVTRATLATIVTDVVALSPQVDALIFTTPGFFARTMPLASTVAMVVSDEENPIVTSVLAPPNRSVATAATIVVSVPRAGLWTTIRDPGCVIRTLPTGFVTSQMNPVPVTLLSSHAVRPKARHTAAKPANADLFIESPQPFWTDTESPGNQMVAGSSVRPT